MAAASLGDARCPLCGGKARVSLSKSSYAVMTMNCCNAQLFTRSPRSDELVRDLIRPAAPGAVLPEVKPEPVRTEKPAQEPVELVRTGGKTVFMEKALAAHAEA